MTYDQVPAFRANGRTSAINMLAGQLGDDRAAGVRRKYGRPLKAVVILGAGELPLE
jgi:peptidyl-prolyl cis-trans isomerase B (cyclophilin B)